MSNPDDWFEIQDPAVDKVAVQQKIAAQMTNPHTDDPVETESPAELAQRLRAEMLGNPDDLWQNFDGDILPKDYVIDWQHPLLGPINAQIRKVINAEIRRYLDRSLEKQTTLNRRLIDAIRELTAENETLRRQMTQLQQDVADDRHAD